MRKEAVELKHKDYNCNDIAVRYLDRALIALIVGIVLCFLATPILIQTRFDKGYGSYLFYWTLNFNKIIYKEI